MSRTPNNTKGQDLVVLSTDEIRGEDFGAGTGNGGPLPLTSGAGGLTAGNSGNVIIGPGAVVSGTVGEVLINGLKTRTNRVQHNLGTGLVVGDFALSAGWGNTATLDSVVGNDSRFLLQITSGGTGQAQNPTLTLTYADGAWPNAPFPLMNDNGTVDGAGGYLAVTFEITTRTTTQAVWTLRSAAATGSTNPYTPVAGDIFKMICHVLG